MIVACKLYTQVRLLICVALFVVIEITVTSCLLDLEIKRALQSILKQRISTWAGQQDSAELFQN